MQVMDEQKLKQRVAKLQQAEKAELVTEWQKLFGKPPPHRCSMELLRGNVIYGLQEQF
jgi:hypothetical protein